MVPLLWHNSASVKLCFISSSPFDTIVAPITGVQRAAVAVIRVSGPDSWKIAECVFRNFPKQAVPRHAYYGHFSTGDDGLTILFEQGASYTNEASAEFSIHGSPVSVEELVKACIFAGARLADPGEFTLRAFSNGRIDLTQAEGVRETVDSLTASQLRAANELREGRLSVAIRSATESLIQVLAMVEASTDFSEEVGELDRAAALKLVQRAENDLTQILKGAAASHILREGLRIAIVGRPNAGKSSLLNALVNSERAIVTEIPGTTRDTVEEMVDLGGVPCLLIDTAGLRDSDNPVELAGIKRSHKAVERADLVWYVYSLAVGWSAEDEAIIQALGRDCTIIANKIDIAPEPGLGIHVSARYRTNLEELIRLITKYAHIEEFANHVLINARHEPLIRQALDDLEGVKNTLQNPLPDDLAAVGLRSAILALGQITGETATHDILERIFRDFCIGK